MDDQSLVGGTACLDAILRNGNWNNTSGTGTTIAILDISGSPAFALDEFHLTTNPDAIAWDINARVSRT